MPVRIQRKREAGWRKPEGAVAVDRSTNWGNPYTGADNALLVCAEHDTGTLFARPEKSQ